jgi:putative ABC transport system permease protein
MSTALQDFRYVLRALAKRPLYAALTVLVLTIAIGSNTTVFSVLNGFLLRPLPYPDGDRLVMVYDSYPKMGIDNAGTAIPDYLERRAQAASLESLAIVATLPLTLSGEGSPERVQVARASPSLLDVLRVAPALGRNFTAAEATTGNDRVAILSYRLWSTRFGADRGLLGRDVRIDGVAYGVIGVMPEGFGFPSRNVDVWIPFAFTPQMTSDAARGTQYSVSVGRLRPDASVEGLNAELAAIVRRNVADGRVGADTIEVTGFTGRAQLLRDTRVGNLEQMVLILQGIVLAVLLIACANIANLQLARTAARRKELAVRAALGAAAGRLVRLVLLESLMLGLAGAAGGLALAKAGLALVRALGLDRTNDGFDFALDGTVLAFTLGAACLAALISGLPPVLGLLRDDLPSAVREAGRSSAAGPRTHGLRNGLVVAQVAMSVALLVGAGLLTRGFYALQSEGPGFDPASIWTAHIALPATYASGEAISQLEQQAVAALGALPGVAAAGFTSVLPFGGSNDQGSTVIDGYVLPEGAAPPHAQHRSIDAGYLPTLGIPVIAGRNFAATEADRVVIVDENVAARYWPNGNALGQRVRRTVEPEGRWSTVIGIVPAVKQATLDEPPKETMYWHYTQRPTSYGFFALRTTLPPEQLTRAAGSAIAALDPDLALFSPLPLDVRVLRSLGPQRTPMVLTLVFAGVAFTLAVIGIYGVLSWAVTQRVGEIGVRMALGARGRDILSLVLRQGGRLVAIGLVAGVAGALALGRVLASQLPNVSALDPAVLAIAVLGLAGAALVACWLPARRAARIDPMRALHEE